MIGHSEQNDAKFKSKALYEPEPLFVRQDTAGSPVRAGKRNVTSVEDRWRIDDDWWRQAPISRMYFSVVLDNGKRTVIYKDLITGRWYRQEY